MEVSITLQDVANIVTFIAPGYFAMKTYGAIYSKADKDSAQLLILSAVCSLPIVAAYNWIFRLGEVSSTKASYALGLVLFSIFIGLTCATVRRVKAVKKLTQRLHLPEPDEDFMHMQFAKMAKDEVVMVKLRNDEFFSGTPQSGKTYKPGEPRAYTFSNVAWFDPDKQRWDERDGNLIINLEDILYMETAKTHKG
ncbi:MAG TPA: hypothetical protein VMR45_06135 [Patescibacteria group bacterium]|nr:hypothetical protein [Patescibacteria group bacterium]